MSSAASSMVPASAACVFGTKGISNYRRVPEAAPEAAPLQRPGSGQPSKTRRRLTTCPRCSGGPRRRRVAGSWRFFMSGSERIQRLTTQIDQKTNKSRPTPRRRVGSDRGQVMVNVASGTWGALPGRRLAPACLLAMLAVASHAVAAPPNVPGISRTQSRIPAGIAAQQRLRIWLINVGQGDAILVELPESVSLALGNPAGDPVNLLIDGGASPINLARKTPEFLHRLYGPHGATIEHMVLTHHDRDHVVGLTRVLEDETIAVANVYVGGLAAFRRGVRDIPLNGNAGGFIGDKNRSLGRFTSTGLLESRYLVDTFGVLKARVAAGELTSDYGDFAAAIVRKTRPAKVQSFQQACVSCGALDAIKAPGSGVRPAFSLTTVWPMKRPRGYSQWDK